MTIPVNIESIMLVYCKITDFRKRVGKNLQSQLANKDDFQSIKMSKKNLLLELFLHKNGLSP